jgi:preprotein translocase subunit YajC
MYFVGIGIFFFVALLCVFAYFAQQKQRRRYEETGKLDPDE